MEYSELKNKIKTYGMSMKEFTIFVGVHETTPTAWKNKKVPLAIIRVVEGLDAKKELSDYKDIAKDALNTKKELAEYINIIKKMCKDTKITF